MRIDVISASQEPVWVPVKTSYNNQAGTPLKDRFEDFFDKLYPKGSKESSVEDRQLGSYSQKR